MSRIIRVDSPGKARSQHMRTAAEVLRRLGQKAEVDEDARDMVALLVYCFRQIDEGLDETALAWEKRNYWIKVEQFRARWAWAGIAAKSLEQIVWNGDWDALPMMLIELLPHFEDIKVAKFTRNPSLWRGAYQRLLQEDDAGGEV